MPKKSRDVDSMTGQKKKNYKVLNASNPNDGSGHIPKCACDRKRCLNGRCGICWMVITALLLVVGIFFILWAGGALGFDFETSGDDTLYELICSNCTDEPTSNPTIAPSAEPTSSPTDAPSVEPTYDPTGDPTVEPSADPTVTPTIDPTSDPTTLDPTSTPTEAPTYLPTVEPTSYPTVSPTLDPSNAPTSEPTEAPTGSPTFEPTEDPTGTPTTSEPTSSPTDEPTAEPTSSPTDEPTAEPTSERRRSYREDMVANLFFFMVDGTTFDNTEFETPQFDDFVLEGYTFSNLKNQFSLANLLTGKNIKHKYSESSVITWAEQIHKKGYKNYYYGSWMTDSEVTPSTPLNRGWDFFFGSAFHSDGANLKYKKDGDFIMEKLQSQLQTIEDEKWSITVNWTAPFLQNGVQMSRTKTPVFPACSRYFEVGGTDFSYPRGLRCQWTMNYDTQFGKVLETLKSTGLWANTIVLFVIGGRKSSIFSVNGGALPGILLNRTNEERHSMLDVVPTILAVGGFSDEEVASAKLDGFPIPGLEFNNIKDNDEQ